jgi:hypothetical protein
MSPEVVRFYGRILGESDKAIKFKIFDVSLDIQDQIVWFPLSQTRSIHRTYSAINGTYDEIVVTEWIARQKNLTECN